MTVGWLFGPVLNMVLRAALPSPQSVPPEDRGEEPKRTLIGSVGRQLV